MIYLRCITATTITTAVCETQQRAEACEAQGLTRCTREEWEESRQDQERQAFDAMWALLVRERVVGDGIR